MKKIPASRRLARLSSFTLVELLVVMGIIVILAAIVAVAGGNAINAAKRASAANMGTQLQTAALSYYTEYSVYPAPPTAGDYLLTDASSDGANWVVLISALCGNINPATAATVTATTITNSRGIAFLSLKSSDVFLTGAAIGAPKNPIGSTTNLYFNIAMDTDYDGLLGTTGNTSGKLPNFAKSLTGAMDFTGSSTAGVAVWENCNAKPTYNNPNFWIHTY